MVARGDLGVECPPEAAGGADEPPRGATSREPGGRRIVTDPAQSWTR